MGENKAEYPMKEPKSMMYQDVYPDSLEGVSGYVMYDMYKNAWGSRY